VYGKSLVIFKANESFQTIYQNQAFRAVVTMHSTLHLRKLLPYKAINFTFVKSLYLVCSELPLQQTRKRDKHEFIVNVNLSLCLTKHHAIKTNWGVEV
jgi:hypothetical protein